jgi:acyl-coenzyme A synthetase/AMP-(fatty) acid ligase
VNFVRDVLDRLPPRDLSLLELARDGSRRGWTFGEVSERCARLAGTLQARGIGRGDVVMTLIGNRPEWVIAMCACMRIGAVVLPCTEQLRAKDLRLRIDVARPRLIVADERNRAELEAALRERKGALRERKGAPRELEGALPAREVVLVPDETLFDARPAPAIELADEDPCLITFTSGTSGEPKAVLHAQRYLHGQHMQARHWLGGRTGELVWCTAASGWSKSARNVFISPWLRGASALLHDARFDPRERLELLERERVSVLCMAPTEYRVIAKRTTLRALPDLRAMVAAGEALNPEVQRAWREATGLEIRDGYGQTETGQLTGMAIGEPARPGSMGRALPGVALEVSAEGELIADPRTVPTFFLGYLGEGVERGADRTWKISDRRAGEPWRTGDRVREDEDGYLWFEGRTDDVIVSAGYRIGPFEVESALVAHPAVAEAAAVAAPDEERGSVVRAVVVLRDGHHPSPALASELQEHVKRETAPYKYPRIVDFAPELPKTASGKIRRAQLRARA